MGTIVWFSCGAASAVAAKLSREIGCKLTRMKGKRIYLDELDPNAKGNRIKSWECGIFCNTK